MVGEWTTVQRGRCGPQSVSNKLNNQENINNNAALSSCFCDESHSSNKASKADDFRR